MFALGNVRILATPWTPSRSVVIPLPPASRRCAAAALAVALLGAAPAARAQPPVSPRFDISRFAIEGATLLDQATLERAVEPFAGGQRSFEDVRAAAKAVEAEYARRGYPSVQVTIPEQRVREGEVALRVSEAQLRRVTVTGNRFFDERNVRRSVPALAEGSTPNVNALGAQLRIGNESPAKQTTVVLRPGGAPGDLEADVRVADERPQRGALTLDNTGVPQTGEWRAGVGYQHANLWARDHVLNVQYVTALSDPDNPASFRPWPNGDVRIAAGSYRVPLYRIGDSIDVYAAYSNVNSGVVQGLFNVAGSGTIYGGRYNLGLPRFAGIDQRLALGFDWKAFDNVVTPVGSPVELVPDVTVHPVSAIWSGAFVRGVTETTAFVALFRNVPGGSNGGQATFDQARPGSVAGYFLQRAGVNFLAALAAGMQLRVNASGQWTREPLVPGEQFGVGGQDSVRGFFERELVGDRGARGTVELYSPDVGRAFAPLDALRLRGLVFLDAGTVRIIDPVPAQAAREDIASTGLGLRLAYARSFSLRLDVGYVLAGGGVRERGDTRGHLSLALVY